MKLRPVEPIYGDIETGGYRTCDICCESMADDPFGETRQFYMCCEVVDAGLVVCEKCVEADDEILAAKEPTDG